MTDGLRAGQVAEQAGVNPETLRYYERRGLLAEPNRTPGGHRIYTDEAVALLRVIKRAQQLGFSLEEISDELEGTGRTRRGDRNLDFRTRVARKALDIDQQVAALVVLRDTLRAALEVGCDDLADCVAEPACPMSQSDFTLRTESL